MARPNQEAIDTFISITGASEAVAVQKLEEHGGDLNEAVNSHFTQRDQNITHPTPFAATQNDFMDIDDDPIEAGTQRPPFPLSATPNFNPFSLLDPTLRQGILARSSAAELTTTEPRVTHPRVVRQIPIEVKDSDARPSHSGLSPAIEDVTGTVDAHGPETHGTIIIDDDDNDEVVQTAHGAHSYGQEEFFGGRSHGRNLAPSAPAIDSVVDYNNDIEEEMIQAAIEASKREVVEAFPNHQIDLTAESSGPSVQQTESHVEDDIARAVSLSLKTAEQEKALREQGGSAGLPVKNVSASDVQELGNPNASNERQGVGTSNEATLSQPKLEAGNSSVQAEDEDVEEKPFVRQRSRRANFGSDSGREALEMEESPPSSPEPRDIGSHPQNNGTAFHSDEWGGMSSLEHDEAVMLEAALFGGIPEGSAYRFGYPLQERTYPRPAPRPPSPTLEAQRILREQQDDEYLASLQADREKELKAMEEAEAAREEERRKEEETHRKLMEEEEAERQLAAKEASLPAEPPTGDENAVNLLVRMPDGSRRGRRFLKSDNLQSLFDFIDVGRVVKPGTYRLVRPYPRRAFSDGESKVSLSELGLTSKQEALFLELI